MNPNDSAHDKHRDDDDDDNELDPTVELLLTLLWEAAHEPSGKPWSLAKLSKRADLPMSTLRRYLTQLQSAGVLDVQMDDEGRGTAALTAEGRELCEALFGEP
ncbi:helix-turn-helix domain-containing protein [Paraburkholderia sp. LEh10]|uniref:helix-turn-helix domain-containing protein n=1 Tax=Paraburkholderia sp. LEh10 TaxID=2821353 RepID=UPI001AE97EF4|nr:helix-turn-helix domain-containing protein [Paraburkholderia sp. LEh10]MBP0594405.1 helix-turn-helix domain-containing protein [Paraburkholderia sp. LEh10]